MKSIARIIDALYRAPDETVATARGPTGQTSRRRAMSRMLTGPGALSYQPQPWPRKP
jgi:hypothetical protein